MGNSGRDLQFNRVDYDDAGSYFCRANSSSGYVVSRSVTITVSPEGSVFLSPINPIRGFQGDQIFTCQAQGGPDNMFQWTFNGSSLTNTNITSTSSQSTLTISNISVSDGGEYTCTVSNLAGNSSSSSSLYVSPYIVTNPAQNVTATNATTMIILECLAAAFPSPTYTWTKVTGPGSPMVVMNDGDSGVLQLSSVIKFNDYGKYVCSASSNNLTVNSSVSTIYISPESSVRADVNDSITTNGSSVSFTCFALGGPDNVFVWLLTNSSFDLGIITSIPPPPLNVSKIVGLLKETYSVLHQSNHGDYVIDSVNATENGGTYTCVVVNTAGLDSSDVQLLVQPTITTQPEDMLTSKGETVSLSCEADSYPPPTYSWFLVTTWQNLLVVEDVPRVTMDDSGRDLQFNGVDYSDAGSYFCRANSSSGYVDSESVTITVSPSGSVQTRPSLVNSFVGSFVQFLCLAQGGPGNQFVWRYLRTGEIIVTTETLNITTSVSGGGQYQCEVFNMAGNDTAYATLNVGPKIVHGPQDQNVTDFEGVIMLHCNISGFPIPSIIWLHNNTDLNISSSGVTIDAMEYNESNPISDQFGQALNTLTIRSPIVNDSGDYACQAITSGIAFYAPVTSNNATVLVQNRPETPFNLTAANLTSHGFTLLWVEPHDNNAPILGYIVRFSDPFFLNATQRTVISSHEQALIDNLHPGVTFNFTVEAFNDIGFGSVSQPLSVTTTEEVPTSSPQNPFCTTINSTAIQVQWEAVPEIDRNGKITYYEVHINPAQFQNISLENVSSSMLLLVVTGLEEFVQYNFTIRAYTSAGPGPFSDITVNRTDQDIPAGSVVNFTVTANSANSLVLSWSPLPAIDVNGELVMYQVQYRIIDQLGFGTDIPEDVGMIKSLDVDAQIQSLIIHMLDNYTTYEVNVSAVTIGVGPPATDTERTEENVPSGPPQNVMAVTTSTTSISASWEAPLMNESNGIIRAYHIRYFIQRNKTSMGRFMEMESDYMYIPNATLKMNFYGLEEGILYGFEVLAVTVGEGPYSPTAFATTETAAPSAPPIPLPVSDNDQLSPRQVYLTWKPISEFDQNGELLFYEVRVVSADQITSKRKRLSLVPNSPEACFLAAGALPEFSVYVLGNETSVLLDGLTPNSSYSFQVRGNTSAGYGSFSMPQKFETGEDVPEPPQSLNVTSLSFTSLNVQWTVPICDNGQRTMYNISYDNITEMVLLGQERQNLLLESTIQVANITDLIPNTTYTISVSACTTIGCGDSITQTIVTGQNCSGLPISPVQVESTVTTTTANISWTASGLSCLPENYSVIFYGFKLQPQLKETEVIFGERTNILATIHVYFVLLEGLEEDSTYNYTVQAMNHNGMTYTNVMQFTTLPDYPSGEPLFCTNSTYNARDIGLQWEEPQLALQNGVIIGYNLTCYSDDPWADLTANLSVTQISTATHFTINPVSPYTDYSCLLSAINEVGEGPTTQCNFSTQQDAPDDPPQNLTSNNFINSVSFEWLPPSVPNGIIQRYIFFIATANITSTYVLDGNQNVKNVDGFSPYQFYSVNVIASTFLDGNFANSPPAVLMDFTLPDRSGPVQDLSVIAVNETTLYISFTTPTHPNGLIKEYQIMVGNILGMPANFSDSITHIEGINEYFTYATGLVICVPYYITMSAVNQVGKGLEAQDINFTRQCIPNSPSGISVLRLNDTHMNVSWSQVPLSEAKGFILYYNINYTKILDDGVGQASVISVSGKETSTLIGNLTPSDAYQVFVSATTSAGDGQYSSDPVIVQRLETLLFQLIGKNFTLCTEWKPETEVTIDSLIQLSLTEVIRDRCQCDFQESFISQAVIWCDQLEVTQFVYRANITSYANYSADEVVGYIEDWVRSGASISIGTMMLTFDSNCPVRINMLSDPVCALASSAVIPARNSINPTSTGLPPSSNTLATIATSVTVAVIIVATVTTIVVVVLACLFKKKKYLWSPSSAPKDQIQELEMKQNPGYKEAPDPPAIPQSTEPTSQDLVIENTQETSPEIMKQD